MKTVFKKANEIPDASSLVVVVKHGTGDVHATATGGANPTEFLGRYADAQLCALYSSGAGHGPTQLATYMSGKVYFERLASMGELFALAGVAPEDFTKLKYVAACGHA